MVGLHPGKSVPLYLGINVFDAMMPMDRELNLSYIAKTQTKGGQILMVLDANPELGSIISEIISEYPDMIVLPYIPTGYKGSEQFYRMSAVLFPKSLSKNPAFANFQIFCLDSACVDSQAFDLIGQEEKILRHKQLVSNMQLQLEKAKEAFGLKVIPLEEYFVEKTKKMLERLGYSAKSYYHTSFCEASLSTLAEPAELKQPIVYKPISDSLLPVRQWCHKDRDFLGRLQHKNLSLPSSCNDKFIKELFERNNRLIGAELLIIEATKQ
jgi:hypothetical protein